MRARCSTASSAERRQCSGRTLGADLPVSTAFLTPHIWANTGAGTAAIELGLVGMYVESAALNGSRGKLA